jgi:hypothetical protein
VFRCVIIADFTLQVLYMPCTYNNWICYMYSSVVKIQSGSVRIREAASDPSRTKIDGEVFRERSLSVSIWREKNESAHGGLMNPYLEFLSLNREVPSRGQKW